MGEVLLQRANIQLVRNNFPLGAAVPGPVAEEMAGIVDLAGAAGSGAAHRSVKERLVRAARRLGLSFERAKAYRYGLVRLVPAEEADRLRQARAELLAERHAALEREQQDIERALAALEATRAATLENSLRQLAGKAVEPKGAPGAGQGEVLATQVRPDQLIVPEPSGGTVR